MVSTSKKFLVLALLVALCTVALASNVVAVQNGNLWAYWTFDTADNNASGDPQDQSGNGRHLAGKGTPTYEAGKLGETSTLDGTTDYFNLGSTWFDGAGDWSANMWAYRDNSATTDYIGGDDCADLGVWTSTTTHQSFVRGSDNAAPSYTEGDAGVGRWVMTTVVFDTTSGNHKIYVNGTLKATEGGSGFNDCTSTHGDFSIGARAAGAHFWPGEIDDVAIWNDYELTQDDIDELWNGGAGMRADSGGSATINQSTYNVTTAYFNHTVWRTDQTWTPIVQDPTPTVTFTISAAQNCSIGLTDVNFSVMTTADSNTKCSTVSTTDHTCTLPSSQDLGWDDTKNVYLACTGSTNTTSDSGALALKRIPEVDSIALSETTQLDLTADGTNYGETSEGWDNTGENTTKNILSINSGNDNYLLVRGTRLDASLNFYINDKKVGNIPSDASGTGTYNVYAFHVNASDISANTSILIEAPASNTDITYLDWIALADTTAISDGIIPGGDLVVLYANVTNSTAVSDTRGTMQDENGAELTSNDTHLAFNSPPDRGYGNQIFVYNVGSSIDANRSFGFKANFTNWSPFVDSGTNRSVEVDSTVPAIHTVTTDLNALTDRNYSFVINVTEKNDDYISIQVNDSSMSNKNLTSDATNVNMWNSTVVYSTPYMKKVNITMVDKADHITTYSFEVRSSNQTVENTTILHNSTWSYDGFYKNVSDTSTLFNLTFQINFTIDSWGDAYITEGNVSYNISDTSPLDLEVIFGDDSINRTLFSDLEKNLTWVTDSWNNTNEDPQNFSNYLRYNLNNSLTLEWENSGVGDVRLFYSKMVKKADDLLNISVHVPMRTTYSTNASSSVDLFKCTSGIDWGAKTCGEWTEITTEFYTQSDQTYHWGTSASEYPTVDTNADGKKDTIYFKIPTITTGGEVMYKMDLDSVNDETTWTTPSEEEEGGGGGGGGTTNGNGGLDEITGGAIASSTGGIFAGTGEFFKTVLKMAEDLWGAIKDQVSILDFSDPATLLLLLGILIAVAGTLVLNRSTGSNTPKTSNLRI